MPDSRIFEGKTTNEAIEKGLKELKVSKNDVEIKVIKDEDKRSFFDILAPRVVKVEIKLKEKREEVKHEVDKEKKKEIIEIDKKNKVIMTELMEHIKKNMKNIKNQKMVRRTYQDNYIYDEMKGFFDSKS